MEAAAGPEVAAAAAQGVTKYGKPLKYHPRLSVPESDLIDRSLLGLLWKGGGAAGALAGEREAIISAPGLDPSEEPNVKYNRVVETAQHRQGYICKNSCNLTAPLLSLLSSSFMLRS